MFLPVGLTYRKLWFLTPALMARKKRVKSPELERSQHEVTFEEDGVEELCQFSLTYLHYIAGPDHGQPEGTTGARQEGGEQVP
jgi:hypothetical protein